jgi:DNA-binding CsgD family transcriptional regulator
MTRRQPTSTTDSDWDSQHEALVQAIYECALHPDGWDQALTQIRHYLNASAINLIGLEVASHDNPFLYTSNIPVDYGKAYQRHWFHEDPWVQAARTRRLNRGGETVAGGMLVENRELKRGAFYHDWLSEQDIQDVLFTNLWGSEPCWGQDPDHPRIVLCFMRGMKAEVFDEADRHKLQALSGHLNQAFRIALQLGLLERGGVLRQAAIDALDQAVFILGEQQELLTINAAGQRLLAQPGNPLRIRANRLVGLGQRCEPGLDAAFSRAARGVAVPMVYQSGSPLAVGTARLVPLNANTARELAVNLTAGYVLYLREPARDDPEAIAAFCRLHAISPAEQAVLRALLHDATPGEIALHLNLGLPTVRSHLLSLRRKTDTQRVSQLLRRVLAATR